MDSFFYYHRLGVSNRVDFSVFDSFNAELIAGARNFATTHPDITVLLFSASTTFRKILDDPVAHGFDNSDHHKSGGGIWYDYIHPTSKVHDYVAKDLAEFLGDVNSAK